MRYGAYWSFPIVVAFVILGGARADITVEEARAVGERALGWSMADWPVETQSVWMAGTRKPVRFAGRGGTCTVDLLTGRFESYNQAIPKVGDQPPVSEAQALDIAKREAERLMGAYASQLTWRNARPLFLDSNHVPIPQPWVGFDAEGPNAADPPRVGLAPQCHVEVFLATGTIRHYAQSIPCDPAPVRLTAEAAGEIARREIGDPAAKILKAELSQQGVRAFWAVKARTPAEPHVVTEPGFEMGHAVTLHHYDPMPTVMYYDIDAVTGEVLHSDAPMGGPGSAEENATSSAPSAMAPPGGAEAPPTPPATAAIAPPPDPEPAARSWLTPVTCGAIGAAVVVLAAALVVIRRRRA